MRDYLAIFKKAVFALAYPVKSFILRKPITSVIIAIVLVLAGYWYYLSSLKEGEIKFAEVKRGTVSQIVSVTGKVKPSKDADLSFEKSGKVAVVYKGVGDRISAGVPLVALESGDVSAKLAEAVAAAKAERAKLEELKKGTRPEDILISEVEVGNAKEGVVNDIKSGYVNADDVVRNKIDQFISNPKSSSPQLNFTLSDFQLKTDIETGRAVMESLLTNWDSAIAPISISNDLSLPTATAKNNLRSVQSYLDKVATAVNSLTASSALSQTTIDGYKAAIISGRTNVTTALESISFSEEKLRNAESKLALKKAGTVKEQIDAQEAKVEAAEASVAALRVDLSKTVLRSPINGVVTEQNAKVGEIAQAAVLMVSVMSEGDYEIEANVPEADIAKIKLGDTADVTLDAYGSDALFKAEIAKIDPAETVIEGVPTYKTTLRFKDGDGRIKSGMTANTDIFGLKRENTLYVPGRAITTKGTSKTVILIEEEKTREIPVATGLRGSNGDVEILSGLREGDKVKTN